MFHMSLLCLYVPDPTHILSNPPLDLQEDLSYDEYPVEIIDRCEKKLRNCSIPYMKVLWTGHKEQESTRELESSMRECFPHLFGEPSESK